MKKVLYTLALLTSFCSIALCQADANQLTNDILTTWDKHVAMNTMLMEAVGADFLADKSSSGGRNVGEQFAHMHNVRMMWLGQVAPDQAKGIDDELDATESLDKGLLKKTVLASDKLVRSILETSLKNQMSFGQMSAVRFMGYLISHESHTRGQIMLALKQSGHQLPPQIGYGIWEW